MSFAFNWPRSFPASFYESSKASLEQALNSGQKLSLVADKIRVVDLNLGTIPPELDLLGIDELSTGDDGFSGRFMLSYSGDAFVSLATNLHVNPLTQYKHALEMLATPSVLLTTAEMFVQLTLSQLRLRCVISMTFSKTNGLALTFKDDPLESLAVSSSFDSFGVVQQFIQSEIENQLRERFRRDLPSLIHRLSQRWCADMAQQTSATHTDAPIIVEQGLKAVATAVVESVHEREPDDSLPYDLSGSVMHPRHASITTRSAGSSPVKNRIGIVNRCEEEGRRLSFDASEATASDSDISEESSEGESGAHSFDRRRHSSTRDRERPSFSGTSPGSSSLVFLSTSPAESSHSSSGSSTWSREGSVLSGAPASSHQAPTTPAQTRIRRSTAADSPIINSLKESTSNFATTFSKPPVPVSVQELRDSLSSDGRPAYVGFKSSHTSRPYDGRLSQSKRDTYAQLSQNPFNADESSENRAPQATRKRFHRLESGPTPRTTPHNSPHKARTLKQAKSRDHLRVRREDLDEYFPVTEEGSSTTTATQGNLFTQDRLPKPSLLNPDIPMQVPMPASLINAGKADFASKNSLRRTMMSSRLRDLERAANGANGPSFRRQQIDREFFTSNGKT